MLISSKVNKGELMFWKGGEVSGGLGVYDKMYQHVLEGVFLMSLLLAESGEHH